MGPTKNVQDVVAEAINAGDAYSFSDFQTLGGGGDFLYVMRTGTKRVHLATVIMGGDGATLVGLFEAPTITVVGTPMTTYNRDRRSIKTSVATVEHTPTITADGTELYQKDLLIDDFGDPCKSGEIVLDPGNTYLFKFTTAGATSLSVFSIFYEE